MFLQYPKVLKKNPENQSLKMREEFAIIKLLEHVKLPDNDNKRGTAPSCSHAVDLASF